MYWGLKKVYFLFLVRKPRSRARLKSDMALFRKPACLASSRDIRVKISATAQQHGNIHQCSETHQLQQDCTSTAINH